MFLLSIFEKFSDINLLISYLEQRNLTCDPISFNDLVIREKEISEPYNWAFKLIWTILAD